MPPFALVAAIIFFLIAGICHALFGGKTPEADACRTYRELHARQTVLLAHGHIRKQVEKQCGSPLDTAEYRETLALTQQFMEKQGFKTKVNDKGLLLKKAP